MESSHVVYYDVAVIEYAGGSFIVIKLEQSARQRRTPVRDIASFVILSQDGKGRGEA